VTDKANIFRKIREETAALSEKTAVIDGSLSLSYGELLSSAERIAACLDEKGFRPFDRVGILCGDSIDYIAVSLAVLSLSAVIVPISPDQSAGEIDQIIDKIAIEHLLFESGTYPDESAEAFPSGLLQQKQLRILRRDVPKVQQADYYRINPAFIRFSSGTTGSSKGVLLSHESIIERTDAADEGLGITSEDKVLWVLSMSFHFVVTILLFLRRGAAIVLCNSSFPEGLVAGIIEHKGTFIYASPFHYNLLVGSEQLSSDDMKNIRLAVSTAVKLPQALAESFSAKFGLRLTEAYGIIEVGLPFINSHEPAGVMEGVGRPLSGYEVQLKDMGENGVGGIRIRGKGMLDAYFSPWQGRESILKDGWFETGDLGRFDESGHLIIVGREKNVINFAGMKIFPDEVESVLNEYPLVKESMVYGMAHPQYGQLPYARLVLKPGNEAKLNIGELRRFCYERMSQYKVPKDFQIIDALPKTASGKVRRENTSC